MTFMPGLGLVKGMALTLRRFFQPKATVMYPEATPQISPKFRGRLQLLYDEYGTLKCETCFQCAQACPIECIDMGGTDTRGRYAVHWGAPEQYAERREESALRRSGRTVPDAAFDHFGAIDLGPVHDLLEDHDHDPHRLLGILEATQAAYGHLPVAAIKEISFRTGAPYALVYGTATYYRHLQFEPPATTGVDASSAPAAAHGSSARRAADVAVNDRRPSDAAYLSGLEQVLSGPSGATPAA